MRKLFVFYLFIFWPIAPTCAIIFNPAFRHSLPEYAILYFLAAYILIYRPIIVGLRLVQAKKLPAKQFAYVFIPGWEAKYFNYLFFNVG
jgi:hypothetical protein